MATCDICHRAIAASICLLFVLFERYVYEVEDTIKKARRKGMRWEELTGDQFPEAVKACEGVCVVALSVVERHGHHLPLGTDTYQGRSMLSRIAAREPIIEFPDYIFAQIPEARHLAGTISIDGDLMITLLDNVCREIARNGCKKVVLLNAHGGNFGLLALYNMLQLYKPKEYVVYIVGPFGAMGSMELPWPREEDGHAGPGETSMMLALRPDLVDMSKIPLDDEGKARNRLQALREAGVQTGIWWYADHPTHYAGNAAHGTAAAGEQILDTIAESIAQAIRAIKADTVAPQLQAEFFAGSQSPA
jgi:creatinine amidohydrolase